jgi:cyclopropane fatty-acyl-phospholipid synthase-like methyltransferase
MYDRYAFTIKNCEPIQNRTFLDVGCGNGLYSIELAKRGAAKVVGIDISEVMVDLCRQTTSAEGLEDRCTFEHTDLLQYVSDSIFDVTFGIGLFDYIRNPLPVLTKMRQLTGEKAILSLPRLWTWRAPVRKARLSTRRCDVFFYTKSRIDSLLSQAGFGTYTITRIGKLHCVVADAK